MKMCENNYEYLEPCHSIHNGPPIAAVSTAGNGYADEDYYVDTWTAGAEYVPNHSDQCQLE